MSIRDKLLIALAGLVFMVVVVPLLVIGVMLYITSDKEFQQKREAREIEGREFGKTTTQEGCIKEGLERARKMTVFELKSNLLNQAFVENCLAASQPIPGFCDGIPRDTLLNTNAESDWKDQQCEKVAMDDANTGCHAVFGAKVYFCREQK
jgi:hypothetical protein